MPRVKNPVSKQVPKLPLNKSSKQDSAKSSPSVSPRENNQKCHFYVSIPSEPTEIDHFQKNAEKKFNYHAGKLNKNNQEVPCKVSLSNPTIEKSKMEDVFDKLSEHLIKSGDKIYYQAHRENPDWKPELLADKFWEKGGLKKSLQNYINNSADGQPYQLKIRLLTCTTGRLGKAKDSYVEKFHQAIIDKYKSLMNERIQETKVKAKKLTFELISKGARGWNFIGKDGRTYVYHCPPAQEKAADKAAHEAFEKGAYERMIGRVDDAEKSTKVTGKVVKYEKSTQIFTEEPPIVEATK